MKTENCPECGGPCEVTWSGLELVENTGDETLARKHYKSYAHQREEVLRKEIESLHSLLEKCRGYIDSSRIKYDAFPPKDEFEKWDLELVTQLLTDIDKTLS